MAGKGKRGEVVKVQTAFSGYKNKGKGRGK